MKKRARRGRSLDSRLADADTPVFLLDARRKVVFVNEGCARLTGWTPEEVIGRVCEYTSDAPHTSIDALTSALCPPFDVLLGREMTVPVYLQHRNGTSAARLVNFFPLKGEDGEVESILGIVTAIHQPARGIDAGPAQNLHAELAAIRIALRKRYGIKSLVCRCESMQRVLEQVALMRSSKASVLLEGEAGTGKEHVARAIHYEGEGRTRAFVPLDCARLSSLELKLALRRLLEPDDGPSRASSLQPGTVYLAQVDHLPRDLQQRVVEAVQAERLGPNSNLRLMAASDGVLEQAMEADRFLSPLFYSLTAVRICLPPLRHRRDDLPLLAQSILESFNRDSDRQVNGFSEQVWHQFRQYNWPGNLDELTAVIHEARNAVSGGQIQVQDLPFRFRTGLDGQAVGPPIVPRPMPLEPLLTQVESEQIQRALEQCRHNKSKAAQLLGMTRARLYRRMQSLGIEDLEESAERTDGKRS
jgi:PAS domain S-box-containing protein